MPISITPLASIIISTKNRRDELATALDSALLQTAPIEVVVVDDGSTDGTSEMVRSQYPTVRLERFEVSQGLIPQRNHLARIATAPILVSIDDDAVFVSPLTIEQTLAEFSDPRVGAVAIPYIDVRISPEVRQRAPDTRQPYAMTEYRGTAHALRRELFLDVNGYRGMLVHQCEEGDYCIRMLARGFVVRMGAADPIHHLESPKRDLTRQIIHNARNNVLFAWHNVPAPWMTIHMVGTTLNLLRYGVRVRYKKATLRGLARAAADILRGRAKRRPVPLRIYRLHRWLKHRGPTAMAQVLQQLDPASNKTLAPS